jgi:hypothetical protein
MQKILHKLVFLDAQDFLMVKITLVNVLEIVRDGELMEIILLHFVFLTALQIHLQIIILIFVLLLVPQVLLQIIQLGDVL